LPDFLQTGGNGTRKGGTKLGRNPELYKAVSAIGGRGKSKPKEAPLTPGF